MHNNPKQSNLHYAIGHYDLQNGYVDKQGNLHIKLYDTYDFNKNDMTPLNQAGKNQMLKGNLIPYFTIHDIIIFKNELDKIW